MSKDSLTQEDQDFKWLMSDKRGRRIVASIMKAGMVDEAVFNGNSRDIFLTGRRSLAMEIMNRAKDYDFDNYIQLLRETHD